MYVQPIRNARIKPWRAKVRKPESTIDFYGEDELCQFIRTLNDLWVGAPSEREKSFFCRTLLFTGCRIHEAVWIQTANCHDTYIDLKKTKASSKDGFIYERPIEWFPEFKPFYDEFTAERRAAGDQFLFPAKRQRLTKFRRPFETVPISVELAHKWWREVVKISGLRYLSSHKGGRKTFATWAAEIMKQSDLQDQLGHMDYHTTDTIYRGSIPGRKFNKPFPRWRITALAPYPVELKKLLNTLVKDKEVFD